MAGNDSTYVKTIPSKDEDSKKRCPRDFRAERVGFEPTVGFPLRRISSAVPSTTQPPFRGTILALGRLDDEISYIRHVRKDEENALPALQVRLLAHEKREEEHESREDGD